MMDGMIAVCIGVCLAAACGLRVFLPLAIASIATKAGLVTPGAGFEWIGSWPAIIGLTTACVVEVAGYSVPWIDHALDTIATPAAAIAGTVLAASQFANVADGHGMLGDLATWAASFLVGGGAASVVQLGTVGTRGASTVSTGGIANPIFAAIESLLALAWSIIAVLAPVLAAIGLAALAAMVIYALMRRRARRRAGRARARPTVDAPAGARPALAA